MATPSPAPPARLVIRPVATQLHWHGVFAEPVFSILANPNVPYAALYRALQPFGARLESFSFDFSRFAQTEITCTIVEIGLSVRLRLERIEVGFLQYRHDDEARAQAISLVTHLHESLANADRAFVVTSTNLSLDTWAAVQSGSLGELMRELVVAPKALGDVTPSVRFSRSGEGRSWALLIEESIRFTEGMYARFDASYTGPCSTSTALTRFETDARDTLRLLGVEQS